MIRNIGKTDIFLDRPLDVVLRKKIQPYTFEVGILQDKIHFAARTRGPLKSFAGGPARRQTRRPNGTLSSVSKEVRKFLGFNYLKRPFEKRKSDLIKFTNGFFKLAFGTSKLSQKKRCENLLQAVVRNPMLRGDYGRNTRRWAKIKGFNRKLFDTGQFFKGITARVRINVSK